MRIKGFSYFLEGHLQKHTLNNTTLVVDGQSLFFKMYKDSKLPFALGCESDRFARYIKTYLENFQNANVKCHFVFKGGHTDKYMLSLHFAGENRLHGRNYVVGQTYEDIVKPIFAKDIWFQVLDELGLEYSICNDDHITECIILARKLCCPVLSFNVQYFFSQVTYIPYNSVVLDEGNQLTCGTATLSSVLERYNLTEEKIILFIMLLDQHQLNKSVFTNFLKHHRMPLKDIDLIHRLLRWLAQHSKKQARDKVFQFLSQSDRATFLEKQTDLENLTLRRKGTDTKMVLYVTDKDKAKITQSDPDWFEKGVFLKYIAIPYVNLYKYRIVKASHFIEDYTQDNSVMLSIEILKYAFDLLTNFEGREICVEHRTASNNEKESTSTYEQSVQKPDHEAATFSIFENGWDNIKRLKLFEHFIVASLQPFDFDRLDAAPADIRLLLIAMVYFSRKKPNVDCEIYSILLSYVMLGVVFEKLDDQRSASGVTAGEKPLDPFTDKELVSATDCDMAWSLMREYFEISQGKLCRIFDRKVLHPLVEFQRCLQELNYLNQLCGAPFDATVYSKTYNGTFVYKILCAMKDDGIKFVQTKLNPAPSVLAFLSGLLGIYESIV